MTTSQPSYAGLWLRLVAALIDFIAMFIPFIFATFLVTVIIRLLGAIRGIHTGAWLATTLPALVLVLVWAYFAVLESCPWQATIGKKVLGLYVVDIEGNRLSFGRATARNLAKYLSTMTAGIGYLMCGFTRERQALHDIVAGCLVLRRPH